MQPRISTTSTYNKTFGPSRLPTRQINLFIEKVHSPRESTSVLARCTHAAKSDCNRRRPPARSLSLSLCVTATMRGGREGGWGVQTPKGGRNRGTGGREAARTQGRGDVRPRGEMSRSRKRRGRHPCPVSGGRTLQPQKKLRSMVGRSVVQMHHEKRLGKTSTLAQ